ncbi:MAG: hypothetical protein Kow0069_39320 [Promethearchaeota archaeon]
MPTMEAQRARAARAEVEEFAKRDDQKELKSYCRSNPSLILYNGLGGAMAFYRAKAAKNAAYKALVGALEGWAANFLGKVDLLQWVLDQDDPMDVALVTEELLKYSAWLKRFAEIKLEGD